MPASKNQLLPMATLTMSHSADRLSVSLTSWASVNKNQEAGSKSTAVEARGFLSPPHDGFGFVVKKDSQQNKQRSVGSKVAPFPKFPHWEASEKRLTDLKKKFRSIKWHQASEVKKNRFSSLTWTQGFWPPKDMEGL
jgi:hypothetical protein